ncbi:MAG: hypothetical protein ABR985_12970, partial [Methanotrichaceae archaeon]
MIGPNLRALTDLELDIVLALSKDEGHSERELCELLKKDKNNLTKVLGRLETEQEFGDPLRFNHVDIIPSKLGLRLHENKEPLSQYIRSKLNPDYLTIMDKDSTHFMTNACDKLNVLLNDSKMFREGHFDSAALSSDVRDLAAIDPPGEALRRLNRRLLEEVYPEAITKSRLSVIFRDMPRKTRKPDPWHHHQKETPYYIRSDLRVFAHILDSMFLNLEKSLPDMEKLEEEEKNLKTMVESHQIVHDELVTKVDDLYKKAFESNEAERSRLWSCTSKLLSSPYAMKLVKKFGFIPVVEIVADKQKIVRGEFRGYVAKATV